MTQKPKFVTEIPGPEAKKALAKDKKYISPSYTRSYPLVAKSGKGLWVEDVDGNTFMDFAGGIAVNATGHCHPRIVQAIQDQTAKLIHMAGTDFYYRSQANLAELLDQVSPIPGTTRSFLCNSGTEAVEGAMKLARYKTGRHGFLAFQGAFHGRTLGSLALTSSKTVHKARMGPFVPGAYHVAYPNPFRKPFAMSDDELGEWAVAEIEKVAFKRYIPADDIAAIFVEPIQGEGGYIVPPKTFFPALRKLADKHGILLVIDEIQAGMGRTGKFWAQEHFGVHADIITSAKGIASGMPLGAILASEDLMDWASGAHANTFGGNPLACVAAIETIKMLQEGLVEHAAKVGSYLTENLNSLAAESRIIGDVRGLGLMIGAEIVTDKESNTPSPELRDKVVDLAFEKGLLLLGCGPNTIRFCPSLIVTQEECDTMLEILAGAVKAAT